jgi:hypothetical protein
MSRDTPAFWLILSLNTDRLVWLVVATFNNLIVPKLKYLGNKVKNGKILPQLRWLVAGFPPRLPGYDPRSDHVGFVVGKVALWQVF